MDKYGVSNEVLYGELRIREAALMRQMQALMSDPTKTASDRTTIESELHQVRGKISELDLGQRDAQ
jgi:hypothetical protein